MAPKSIWASWAALVPPGRPSSDSSSESSAFSEPQPSSSSSARLREIVGPGTKGAEGVWAFWAIRWKGLVDSEGAGGAGGTGAGAVVGCWGSVVEGWAIILNQGFLLSVSVDGVGTAGGETTTAG